MGWNRVHTALVVSYVPARGSLHQEELLLLCDSEQFVQFLHGQSEWLLAQDMLATLQCTLGIQMMERMRRPDVYSVHILACQQRSSKASYRIRIHLLV